MRQEKYIGMDVHQAAISVAVRDVQGEQRNYENQKAKPLQRSQWNLRWVSRNKPSTPVEAELFSWHPPALSEAPVTAIDETPIEFFARRSWSCRLLPADR